MTDWDQKKLEIEHECAKLIVQFANYNDSGDYRALADLFTEDGVFARPTDPANPIRGRANILARFEQKPKELLTVHFITNIDVAVESGEAARGFSLVMLYTGTRSEGTRLPLPAAPQVLIGSFSSRFAHTPEGWRFVEHLGSLWLTTGTK
jgi:ketosteroid isomerase-like protein